MIKPYYDHAGITIYHGDCREIIGCIPPVDLVITDPPYDAEAHTTMRRTRATIEGRRSEDTIPFAALTESLREWICALPCNWLLVFCQAEAVGKYQTLLGPKYRRPMVWVKPDSSPQFTGDRPAMGYESIIAAWCGDGKSLWNGGGRRGVFTVNATDFERFHPTQKPEKLMMDLIALFSNPSGIVLDPFMGSGTTLRAAKDLGRRAIGIEIEERYCEIAANRLAQEVLALA